MFDRLRGLVPDEFSRPMAFAVLFYLLHLLLLPRVTATEATLLLAIVGLGVAWKMGHFTPAFHDVYVPLLLYGLASLASALAAPDPLASLRDASDVWLLIAFPVGLGLFRAHRRMYQAALLTLATMAAVQAAIGIVQFLQRDGILERRITGSASHVMTFAGILLPISLFALILGIEKRRPLAIVAGGLCLAALGLSLTRSAWIGWVAGILLYLIARRPRWLVLLVPAAILVLTFSPLALFGRLISSFDPLQSSNLDRIRMAQAGVEMIRDRPLFGLGPGNVKPNYPIYRMPDAPRVGVPHLHSNPIQIWAERGVVALFAYGLFIVLVLRECLRSVRRRAEPDPWGYAAATAVVGLTVAGLFEFNFGDSEVLLGLLAVSAMACARAELPDPPGQGFGTRG